VTPSSKRHQAALGFAARAMPGESRQLDRSLDRFGPAVLKKCAVQSRKLAQLLPQRSLILVVVEIRDVDQLRRLLANRLDDARMRVPQGIHSQPGNEVEILLALDVVEKHSLAPRQHHWIAAISRQQIFPFEFRNLLKG